jgi:cytochrome oxidase assembly protein ShyY1
MALRRRLRPNLAGVLATLFFAPLLFSLGLWQYQRGEEKAALFAQYDQLESAPEATFSELGVDIAEAGNRFRPVRIDRLTWVPGVPDIVLSNRLFRGQTGVWLFRAAKLPNDDAWLLINLGWLPSDRGASTPNVPIPSSPEGPLLGRIAGWPEVGIRIGNIDDLKPRQGRVVTPYLDAELAERWLSHPVQAVTIQLTEQATPWVRSWRPDLLPPSRHYGYSVQWFALFITLLVIFVVMSWRRGRRMESAT